MNAVEQLAPLVGVLAACAALAVSRAMFYRRQWSPARDRDRRQRVRSPPKSGSVFWTWRIRNASLTSRRRRS
jgi:hypothetical protein